MSQPKPKTVLDWGKFKARGEKIVMLSCYDAPSARIAAEAGVELLLVGDSMAMAILGYDNTLPLTIEESLHHCKAVRRGAPTAFVVGDMPFLSFGSQIHDAVQNAGRYLKEAGCNAVKIEGGAEMAPLVQALTQVGIPVIGHIGLLPQKVLVSGYRVQGKNEDAADRIMHDAVALQNAGAFMVVLECIPEALSARITSSLEIPTIGIGAGINCDGQVQVIHDLIGLFEAFTPKHAKRYTDVGNQMRNAITMYVNEVKSKIFPADENSFK